MINNIKMHKYLNKYSLLLTALSVLPVVASAANGDGSSSVNVVLIGLISLIIILLFAIGLLGSALVQLGIAYQNKMREEKKGKSTGFIKMLVMLIAAGTLSFTATAQEVEEVAAPVSKSIAGMLKEEFYLLVGVIVLELIVLLVMMLLMRILIQALAKKPGEEVVVVRKKRKPFWDRFNNAVAIEREEDIMLDHDYDGIQELDNSLPPWWKYGFYLTIVIAFIYMWYYHGGGNGPSSREEFVAEVEKAENEVREYLAKSAENVDENTVTMLSGLDLQQGRQIFEQNCAACHNMDGGGNTIGPNLTDQYWLHGGSLKDVFKTIKYGWPDKGMKSWKDDFSPRQIAQLASFVRSLQGTTPANPKAPQGEIYIEEAAEGEEVKKGIGETVDTTANTTEVLEG